MSSLTRGVSRLLRRARRRFLGRDIHVWFDDSYRLSLTTAVSVDTRRSAKALWCLTDFGVVHQRHLHFPTRVLYTDLLRVHDDEYLETLTRPATLARIFGVDPSDIVVAEVLTTVRVATGGTIEAALVAIDQRTVTMNMLGGFHHAEPAKGSGFCPVNDIAVAVAVARSEGFEGQTVILDLDAHPPDGLAACFAGDDDVWIGSLSGSDWGSLPGVDETVLPEGAGDDVYLDALRSLLTRSPRGDLAFVIAGGDVLQSDPFGLLGCTLAGARERDRLVADHLGSMPQVWLPGGGYSADAWRVLAGTGLTLTLRTRKPIPDSYHPVAARFHKIAKTLDPSRLEGEGEAFLTEEDLAEMFGGGRSHPRLLNYYTRDGIEYALARYGVFDHIRRLGYGDVSVTIDQLGIGDRVRVFGVADGEEHLLIECSLAIEELPWSVDGEVEAEAHRYLYVHWLTLRHPRARFSTSRPRLPGQEVPGLGLATEATQALIRMARRLDLDGLAYKPAYFHTAYAGRNRLYFLNPERDARFRGMLAAFSALPLLEVTLAAAEGRLLLDGERYEWEADTMVFDFATETPPALASDELARQAARWSIQRNEE